MLDAGRPELDGGDAEEGRARHHRGEVNRGVRPHEVHGLGRREQAGPMPEDHVVGVGDRRRPVDGSRRGVGDRVEVGRVVRVHLERGELDAVHDHEGHGSSGRLREGPRDARRVSEVREDLHVAVREDVEGGLERVDRIVAVEFVAADQNEDEADRDQALFPRRHESTLRRETGHKRSCTVIILRDLRGRPEGRLGRRMKPSIRTCSHDVRGWYQFRYHRQLCTISIRGWRPPFLLMGNEVQGSVKVL